MKKKGYWIKRIQHTVIRLALTGDVDGFPNEVVMDILGEKETTKRLKKFAEKLNE